MLEGGRVAEGGGVAALGGRLAVEGAGVTVLVRGVAAEGDGVEAEGDRVGAAVEEDVGVAALGVGAAEEDGGGVAEGLAEVTLMATFWPEEQRPGTVQMKKCWPAVVRVILAGGTVEMERVLAPLHESKAAFVTSATSCAPLLKLKTKMSSTSNMLLLAQA